METKYTLSGDGNRMVTGEATTGEDKQYAQ